MEKNECGLLPYFYKEYSENVKDAIKYLLRQLISKAKILDYVEKIQRNKLDRELIKRELIRPEIFEIFQQMMKQYGFEDLKLVRKQVLKKTKS